MRRLTIQKEGLVDLQSDVKCSELA